MLDGFCITDFNVFQFMGNNAVAETVLTDGKAGNPVTIYLGYGIGLFLGILISGGVSGRKFVVKSLKLGLIKMTSVLRGFRRASESSCDSRRSNRR